jgi:hypothetical protein
MEDASNVRRDPVSLTDPSLAVGGTQGGRAQIAYIIPYDNDAAPALAYRLQHEGFRITVAARTLTAGGRTWPRGTLVVRVSRNPERLHEAMARLARETGTRVWSVNTGFYESGETGVGSENRGKAAQIAVQSRSVAEDLPEKPLVSFGRHRR